MVRYCAAVNCTNGPKKDDRISLFRFPLNDKTLLKVWLTKIGRGNTFEPKEWSQLCSEHFTPDCFEYQPFTGRRQLKPGSIPTIFSHRPAEPPNKRARTSYEFGASVSPPHYQEETDDNVEMVCASTQTQEDAISSLLKQVNDLQEETVMLNERLHKAQFRFRNFQYNDKVLIALTGFDYHQFTTIFDFFKLNSLDSSRNSLSAEDQFFLFLVRLKTGVIEEFLSVLFSLSQGSISRIFNLVLDTIYAKAKTVDIWPNRKQTHRHMLPSFYAYFPNCRVIIDCTEFYIQKPSNPREQQQTFSYYKNGNTVKCLIGIAPSGAISYISDVWGGAISDKALFNKSGLLEKFEPGDVILADRGFLIKKEVESRGCTVRMPHFLSGKVQFTLDERKSNKMISRFRVHVERAIGRIKRFKYFEGPIPYPCLPSVNKVIYTVSFLTNFFNPLINISKCT